MEVRGQSEHAGRGQGVSKGFDAVFQELRAILKRHAGSLAVSDDGPGRYCLDAPIGPATLKGWGGKAKRPTIPVAWTEIGKAYVSFHLMGLEAVSASISPALKTRLQGKTCFNFSTPDATLFAELDAITGRSIAALKKGGYCA
jgi:hypothetical protein